MKLLSSMLHSLALSGSQRKSYPAQTASAYSSTKHPEPAIHPKCKTHTSTPARTTTALSSAEFFDDVPADDSTILFKDYERSMLNLNRDLLSHQQTQAMIDGLAIGPFIAININPQFQACLDQALVNFKPDNETRRPKNEHKHIDQFHCESIPLAVYSNGVFKPYDGELKAGETLITGRQFINSLAKYLSQATGKPIVADLMIHYTVAAGLTTFDGHIDELEIHGTYSTALLDIDLPTTPFFNSKCFEEAGVNTKEEFITYMNEHPKEATRIIRDHGTYLPKGAICFFSGGLYSEGQYLGMPHAGPDPVQDAERRFFGFSFSEDKTGFYGFY